MAPLKQLFLVANQTTILILPATSFPFCKTDLIVDERIGLGVPPQPQDLLAQHFNIFTLRGDFRSLISIRPINIASGCWTLCPQSILHG